jgi:two-component system chemotaxis response regulator CheY
MGEKIVLVVDDDAFARDLLVKICKHFDCVAHEAEDGEAAWKLWQELNPALTITDIYMPKMNGVQLLRNIRRADSKAKVMLMTGYDHYKQLIEDHNSQPTDFVVKPFDVATVGRKIRELVNG